MGFAQEARRGGRCGRTAEANAKGSVLASLDFKQAFDRVAPARVLAFLKRRGFPEWLTKAISLLWERQQRILQLSGNSRPQVVSVSTSMPQGDSLAP